MNTIISQCGAGQETGSIRRGKARLLAVLIGSVGICGVAVGQTTQPEQPKSVEELKRRLIGEWAGVNEHSGLRMIFDADEIKRYQVLQDAHVELLEKKVPLVEDGQTFHLMFHARYEPLNVKWIELTSVVRTGPDKEVTNVPDRIGFEFLSGNRLRMTEGDKEKNTTGHTIVFEKQGLPPGSAEGETLLKRGTRIFSDNGKFFMEFQADGNLVVRQADGTFHWGLADSLPAGKYNDVKTVRLQADGNLVASGEDAQGNRTFIWSAIDYTPRTPTRLNLTDDGVLQLVSDTPAAEVLWSTKKEK